MVIKIYIIKINILKKNMGQEMSLKKVSPVLLSNQKALFVC